MKPTASPASINSAAAAQPRSGAQAPAGPTGPGAESKADMSGAFAGKPAVGVARQLSTLSGAMSELKDSHPVQYYDHGPHHGTAHHRRHEPLAGMNPKKLK